MMKRLGQKGIEKWSESEMKGFNNLSLLAGMIPDLGRWSAKAKEEMLDLLKAKGGKREREYVLRTQHHDELLDFLEKVTSS